MFTEQQLIEEIRRRFHGVSVSVGIGDDAAVVDLPPQCSTVMCSDILVEGTHFHRSRHPAHALGFKAIAINVSDVGAMGGVPVFALLSVALPTDLSAGWVREFLDGVALACRNLEVVLVGGDSSRGPHVVIDVSVVGHVVRGHAVRRSGARPGDAIFVTGTLGGSAYGLQKLRAGTPVDDEAVQRHLYPEPRHRLGRAIAPQASSMIDVSDGFSVDLGHILDASKVAARVDPRRIPRATGATMEMALHGGEDYELIVTGKALPTAMEGIRLTHVGDIIKADGIYETELISESGHEVLERKGWQHF